MPHELPDLPWPADAFDPLIREQVMLDHHQLHRGYIELLNRTEDAMKAAKHAPEEEAVAWAHTLGRQYAHALAGHRLHTLYWHSMAPGPVVPLTPGLRTQMTEDFGELHRFRSLVAGLAASVHGAGWVVLAWCPVSRALRLLALEGHVNGLPQGLALLMAVDLWEHAYPGDSRGSWVDTFLIQLIDWQAVGERFDRAREVAL